MPGLQSNSGSVSQDRAIVEALEQFWNSPEQSYEQFMSTFTHFTIENASLKVRQDYGNLIGEMNRRESADRSVNEEDQRASRPGQQQSHHALTTDLEELVLDGSVTVGRLGNEGSPPSAQPVKFDNFLDDTEAEEEPLYAALDVCVLPGGVEEDLPAYTPSFCHHALLELSSTATHCRTHSPQTTAECQSDTEEVVPFSLDDTFDYDNVVLSHKHAIQYSTS